MINAEHVERILRNRYPDLESVGHGVFRGVDRHVAREYAIRYFDLNDQLNVTAPLLKRYQEEMLSEMYFSTKVATDLRWNHYLYFVTSQEQSQQSEFSRSKATIEADREYARKQVVLEGDVAELLAQEEASQPSFPLPVDLATMWSESLEKNDLGFVLDDQISVPEAVRRIAVGQKDKAKRPISSTALLPAEQAAASHFLKHLTIHGFRPHPAEKTHALGRVNLIVGTNGVGKTSLLEALEFAYCGRNRRATVVSADTSIVLEMKGTEEKLSSTMAPARLRARHSNWYAKAELKTVTIQDSFGKFNFLDTDAAVNLSVATSTQQIGADVTRLVLGAEAEHLTDRVRRVRDKVQDDLKDNQREAKTCEQLKLAAQNRLDVIKNSPKLSDGLFIELLSALQQIGWHQPPDNKGAVVSLRQALQGAIASVALLLHSDVSVLHSDEQGIQQFLTELNDVAEQASTLHDRKKSAALELSEAQRALQGYTQRVTAIDALMPYIQADFQNVVEQVLKLQNAISTRDANLAAFHHDPQEVSVAHLLELPTSNAASVVQAQIGQLQKRLSATQASLKSFEATQSSVTVLHQRLLSTAQDLLQRIPNADHCPLCHTEFEEGQLLLRILTDSKSDASDQLVKFQAEITEVENELRKAQAAELTLLPLCEYLGDRVMSVSVAEALTVVKREKVALERERTELLSVQEKLERLRSNGLSSDDLSKKLLAAGLNILQTEAELQALRTNSGDELPSLQTTTQDSQQKLLDIQRETEALATRLSMDISLAPDALALKIRVRIEKFETALEAKQTLLSFMEIGSGATVDSIVVNLATTQELLVKMVTADSQETANSTALENETRTIEDFTKKLKEYNAKIKHLVEADRALGDLINQSSGSELASRILAENADEIGRTFASIHMPNEFELKAEEGKLKIIRRQSGAEVDLNQMSTGQRAAFALSLFLAMNARLRSGPPVLLFDDPVAHVDDINVLSFLDHLRDLAIRGSRQIFFATADTKLAGLFRHKFRFLGSEEFREISLVRS